MTPSKRLFDLVLITLLLPILVPVGLVISVLILVTDGRPILYISERMTSSTRSFRLWKFRTMTVVPEESGVSGRHKTNRITKLGRLLRRIHADEIPQAWNVIWGHLSFVGPRPPLRSVVEEFPEVYGKVLECRPGLTGMASFFFNRHEDWVLRDCEDADEAASVYARRCVPQKARLDLIYQRNQSMALDLWLLWLTAARIFRLPNGRKK